MPRVHTDLIRGRQAASILSRQGIWQIVPAPEAQLVNPWLRELARILAAVAVEDIADGPGEPVASANAAGGRGPRESGSNGAGSSQQNDSGDRRHESLSAAER